MSFFIKRGGQLYLTGFSNLLPIVMLKSGKLHALISRWSADRWKTWVVYILLSGHIPSKSHTF